MEDAIIAGLDNTLPTTTNIIRKLAIIFFTI